MRRASGLLTLAGCLLVAGHGWHFRYVITLLTGSSFLGPGVQPGDVPEPTPEPKPTIVLQFGFHSMAFSSDTLGLDAAGDRPVSYSEGTENAEVLLLRWAAWGYAVTLMLTGVALALRRFRFAPLPALTGLFAMGLAVEPVARSMLGAPTSPESFSRVDYELGPTWSSIAAGAAWCVALLLAWLAPPGSKPQSRTIDPRTFD